MSSSVDFPGQSAGVGVCVCSVLLWLIQTFLNFVGLCSNASGLDERREKFSNFMPSRLAGLVVSRD